MLEYLNDVPGVKYGLFAMAMASSSSGDAWSKRCFMKPSAVMYVSWNPGSPR
ncbi:hypothetical protein SPURM210S_00437 [Streptomyces purpurascens]